jgi:acetyl-CoA carboxylase biotin carboxyl carrier protein
VAERDLTYEDILQIVELIKSASHFSQFRLKVGDIEVEMRRADATPRLAAAEPARSIEPETRREERRFAESTHLVRSPMVGTFYRAPAPDKPPFVEVGQVVEPDTTVCIIEVMKLMNSIAAGTHGLVSEILVANGAGVEYGEVLMVIEPRKP